MLAACIALIGEGNREGGYRTVLGVALGVVLVVLGARLLHAREGGDGDEEHDPIAGALSQASAARRAIMLVGIMTVHSFAEGIGVGVSYGGGEELGTFITAAIAVHNIPEGLAISLVLVAQGTSLPKAAAWSIFSSLPQPLMAIPAYLFVEQFRPLLPVGLGIAAGAMIWMILEDLLPDAFERVSPAAVAITATLSMAAMLLFQQVLQVA
jgi:zinc transporter, ZIP family